MSVYFRLTRLTN